MVKDLQRAQTIKVLDKKGEEDKEDPDEKKEVEFIEKEHLKAMVSEKNKQI